MSKQKELGQFYTNLKIAQFMVDWLLQFNPTSICDPAFGLGIFYTVAKELGYEGQFKAIEVDSDTTNKLSFTDNNLEIYCKDYFSDWGEYDAIVCNPPYLKFHNFDNIKISKQLSNLYSSKISGYINSASAFLLKSILELKSGGRLAYILPFEFLNTGYGTEVKKILLRYGSIYNIIRVEDELGAFDNVITTCCIVFFEKHIKTGFVTFSSMKSIDELSVEVCSKVEREKLICYDKWNKYFDTTTKNLDLKDFVELSYYGKFKRGIATGANKFFSLSVSDIEKLGLSLNEISLCITKSGQVINSILDKERIHYLINSNKKVYLLNVTDYTSEAVKQYIAWGEEQGYIDILPSLKGGDSLVNLH